MQSYSNKDFFISATRITGSMHILDKNTLFRMILAISMKNVDQTTIMSLIDGLIMNDDM